MGVTYRHYLMPRDNTYRPEPEDLTRLINALYEAKFLGEYRVSPEVAIVVTLDEGEPMADDVTFAACLGARRYKPFPCPCTPDDFAALHGHEYSLAWTVESGVESGLKYPLSSAPDYPDPFYEVEFQVANNFIYHMSQAIDPFKQDLICRCGQLLQFSPSSDSEFLYNSPRIHRRCPCCGMQFRPQDHTAQVRDGWLGEASECPGGATYLFAIIIDCSNCRPCEWPILASDSFLEVVTKALGQPFYQLGSDH